MGEVLVCTHKGLLMGVVPVYTEDPNSGDSGVIIRHWSFAVLASALMGFWRLWSTIAGKEYVPVMVTGELDEPLRIEVG